MIVQSYVGILVLNNYSCERVWNEVRAGLKPDPHLYGLNYFAACGYDVELVPLRPLWRQQRMNALARRLSPLVPLGACGLAT